MVVSSTYITIEFSVCAVMSVQCEQEEAGHTALGDSSVEH